uniref:C-X-C motif chemokine n=1 Tax=Chrysemys picta bellii TaxID=8478 RepID=A0A8C3HI07_CHRPI
MLIRDTGLLARTPDWASEALGSSLGSPTRLVDDLVLVTSPLCASVSLSLRCHCLQTVSGLISPKHLLHVEIIPKGPQCGTVEVIATLKTSQQICLDPEAKWVKMIINRILRR